MKRRRFIPVMLTPFEKDGKVDYNCLKKLTEYYLEKGAGGLFVNCLSSEMYELKEEERLNITKLVVDIADGEVPVVSTGTFGGPVEEQAGFIKRLQDIGVNAAIVITSIFADKNDPDELLEKNLDQLIERTEDAKLGFYECPMPYKRVLPAEVLGRLAVGGRIGYYKDTSLDEQSIRAKLKATGGLGVELYDAYMVNAVSSLNAGCAGLSCIQGNYFPELVNWLCQNFQAPEYAASVKKVQQFFTDHMDIMHAVYPVSAKYMLQKRGFDIELTTRQLLETLDQDMVSGLDRLLLEFNQLAADIELKQMSDVHCTCLTLPNGGNLIPPICYGWKDSPYVTYYQCIRSLKFQLGDEVYVFSCVTSAHMLNK